MVLGEMDVTSAKPKPGRRRGGRQLSGGQPEAASVPVDDVHLVRIT